MGVPKQTTWEVDVLSSPRVALLASSVGVGGRGVTRLGWEGQSRKPQEATGCVFEGAEFGVQGGTEGEEAGGEPLPRLQVPFQSLG